ncbi:MAG: hypothetical protein HY904_13030 [Deltaproteobacteria bacterium]|nr:hypothetical protein [Deltaproteobacteria bacterium]
MLPVVRVALLLLAVCLPTVARAQAAPADNAAPLPPASEGEFVPYAPAPPADAAATPPPATTTTTTPAPAAQPPPPAAPPPAAVEAPPPVINAPPPAAPASPRTDDKCGGPRRGFFRGPIPNWAAGAVAGGAVGALGFSLLGLGAALVINIAVVRGYLPTPSAQLPGVYALPLAALPLGAVLGAVVGGVAAPFIPTLPISRPCTTGPGNDPTLRQSGTASAPGTG